MEIALIFAGGNNPLLRLVDDLPRGDLVVAADGGYDTAVELGYPVDVIVGDFDSITETEIPDQVVIQRHPVDKDATDLELAFELVAREDPGRIVVVGAGGGRLDHELAVAGLLCSDRWSHVEEIDWVSDRARAYVVRGRRILHGDVGSMMTLIPMNGDALGVTTKGLRWELRGETLPAGTTRGVSNVMEAPIADIGVQSGCLLVVGAESAAQAGSDAGV